MILSKIIKIVATRSINQSINKFISRHSTEARATVRLCRIKKKCLETDLKCVNGWSSSTVQCKSSKVSEQQLRNDEQQCPNCAAELTETSCVDDRSTRDRPSLRLNCPRPCLRRSLRSFTVSGI